MSSLINPSVFVTTIRRNLGLDLVVTNEVQQYFRHRILGDFDKKFILPSLPAAELRKRAISKFKEVNARMGILNSEYTHGLSEQWFQDATLRRARYFVHEILGDSPVGLLDEMFTRCGHSSGTSIGVKYFDTSVEAKSTWPLSGSASCIRLWEHYRNWDSDYYTQICNLNEASPHRGEVVFTDCSRATTVPKSSSIDRFISVEPTLNMFFQQGILAYMSELLESYGLAVRSDQELHRYLAFEGSVTDRLSTIDFSSMSDSLSLAICHFLLPKKWYSLLFTLRSHRTVLPDGEVVSLNMMSTMGNATTFPLETLLLYCLAESSCCTMRDEPSLSRLRKNCFVYGDDCIVPCWATDEFLRVCTLVGFATNEDKTFRNGPFRESCGGHFYRGRDVRPFYLKSLPASRRRKDIEAYLYTVINGVLRMYIKYFGTLSYVYSKELLKYLFRLLHSYTKLVKFVPEDFPEDSGIAFIRDSGRICREYSIRPSRVGVNRHGMLHFCYLRYELPKQRPVHDGIRYALLLKRGLRVHEEHLSRYKVRKGGFYVERVIKFGQGQFLHLPSFYHFCSTLAD
jgi:hypothetical protein